MTQEADVRFAQGEDIARHRAQARKARAEERIARELACKGLV